MGAAMRAKAGAYKAKGDAEAARLAFAGSLLKGMANVAVKVQGIYDKQNDDYLKASYELGSYQDAVKEGNVAYDPIKMRELVSRKDRALAVRDSWRTKFGMDVFIKQASVAEVANDMIAGHDMPDSVADAIARKSGIIAKGGEADEHE